ncbi:hypothetical protein ACIRFF_15625 [Streptomyces cyaneofuscatus]
MSARNDPDAIDAAHAHPLIATIDPDAPYTGSYSTDGVHWQPVAGHPQVCGGHVQVEIAAAVRRGGAAVEHRGVITISQPGRETGRWTPTT